MEGAISNSPTTRIAVVTGGNKGIGFEVCRQLAGSGVAVVLTARDEAKGTAAAEKIKELGLSNVIFHQLEVTDGSSIDRLADFLKNRFGRLDILVNNAAIGGCELVDDPSFGPRPAAEKFSGMDGEKRVEWMWKNCRETYDDAKACLQTNYYGTKHVTEALLPLLLCSSDGRIVNVTSGFGLLRFFRSEDLKRELDDVDSLTEERLDELLATFLRDFEAGAAEARGWPTEFSAYKVAMNAYSRILARRHPALRVNVVDPGYVKTDMTKELGAPRARGRRGPGGVRGASPGRRRDRRVLWRRRGGGAVAVRVIGDVWARHGTARLVLGCGRARVASSPGPARPQLWITWCCVACSACRITLELSSCGAVELAVM